MAEMLTFSFSGSLLQRGFWLYVWQVTTADGREVLYVGRTGDSSSPHAQSPFNRLSQHLGSNKNANALRRQLEAAGIRPESCRSFEMIAYGPVLAEAHSMDTHTPRRNIVARLEMELRDALHAAGYTVLNAVSCRHPLHDSHWMAVRNAFAARFPKLAKDGPQ